MSSVVAQLQQLLDWGLSMHACVRQQPLADAICLALLSTQLGHAKRLHQDLVCHIYQAVLVYWAVWPLLAAAAAYNTSSCNIQQQDMLMWTGRALYDDQQRTPVRNFSSILLT